MAVVCYTPFLKDRSNYILNMLIIDSFVVQKPGEIIENRQEDPRNFKLIMEFIKALPVSLLLLLFITNFHFVSD